MEVNSSLEDRFQSTSWRSRSVAYQELQAKLQKSSVQDDIFCQYTGKLESFLKDPDDTAFESAVNLCLIFISKLETEQNKIISKHIPQICEELIEKGFNAKLATKNASLKCIIEFGGCGLGDEAMQFVLSIGLVHMTHKIVLSSIEVCTQAIKIYGPNVFSPSPILQAIKPLFNHKDTKISSASYSFVSELYRYMGPSIKNILPSLSDSEMAQLNEIFSKTEFETQIIPEKIPRRSSGVSSLCHLDAQKKMNRTSLFLISIQWNCLKMLIFYLN
eukprot:c18566_g1_i1.p1 GENE.c18566_g1_i1~~c18566_g1_i1.p1  ORF type:complete len:274 (-),score=65.34 c18566_g1_i1:778-1599(-)